MQKFSINRAALKLILPGRADRPVHRLLKETSSFFVNVGSHPSHKIRVAVRTDQYRNLRELFVLKTQFTSDQINRVAVWRRRTISARPFKPINCAGFMNDCHEYISP